MKGKRYAEEFKREAVKQVTEKRLFGQRRGKAARYDDPQPVYLAKEV